jgi:hypothetical protein
LARVEGGGPGAARRRFCTPQPSSKPLGWGRGGCVVCQAGGFVPSLDSTWVARTCTGGSHLHTFHPPLLLLCGGRERVRARHAVAVGRPAQERRPDAGPGGSAVHEPAGPRGPRPAPRPGPPRQRSGGHAPAPRPAPRPCRRRRRRSGHARRRPSHCPSHLLIQLPSHRSSARARVAGPRVPLSHS